MNDFKRISMVRKAMVAGQGRIVVLAATIALLFAAVGVFHSATHVAVVRSGYELGKVEARYRELLRENERLKMERATLRSAPRLESIARAQLNLARPTASQIVVLKPAAVAAATAQSKNTVVAAIAPAQRP